MPQVTRLGLYGGPRAPYAGFVAAGASIALATSATLTEALIVAGGESITLTVSNDTWVATVGDDNAITDALILGLDSDGAEATGWDAVVKAGLAHGDVTRDSDTQLTILLPAFASYDIAANETITATIPATALTGGVETVASPTFDVAVVAVVVTTGPDILTRGGKRRQRRYPRWVQIDGRRYRVFSLQEERDLLERIFAELRAAEAKSETPIAQRQIRKRRLRLEKRIVQVDDSQARWLARLRKEDEELLLLLH